MRTFSWLKIGSAISVSVAVIVWILLISDNSVETFLATIMGLTSGSVFYFVVANKNPTRLCKIPIFFKGKALVGLVITLLLVFFVPSINDVYISSWLSIPLINWIRFIVVTAFCMFIPGFVILRCIDRKRKISIGVYMILAVLLSIFLTSMLWYLAKTLSFSESLINASFLALQCTLMFVYFQVIGKDADSNKAKPRILNLSEILVLGSLVLFSAFFVFLQQFVYNPFIRGDNWNYLSTSNYMHKSLPALRPVGKYYAITPPLFYEQFISALFRLSGFPSVNSMMIISVAITSLIPIAFYIMSMSYTKNKGSSILSAFIYIAFSGFGWVPFIFQKIGDGVKSYSPQDLLMTLENGASSVLNDTMQPQGLPPEGFKTYVLGILAIIMLLFLLESNLPSKTRAFLIAALTAFAFHVHIEDVLIWVFVFVPAYVLLSKKELTEIRKNVIAIGIGFIITFVIGLTYPIDFVAAFTLEYLLVAIILCSAFGYTFVRSRLKIGTLRSILHRIKPNILFLVCYFYMLSTLVLVLYGYQNMYYGKLIVYAGFTFPWYYYPLSFGIIGLLILFGVFMKTFENRKMGTLLLFMIFLLILGKLVSYINVTFFFTGVKEWRIIYRIIPIPASLLAGVALYRLMQCLKNITLKVRFRLRNSPKAFGFHLHSISAVLFVLVIILGVSSTILASEYWMFSNATPFGPSSTTAEDIETVNYIYQNLPIDLRIATSSSESKALIKLAGSATATPSIYPDILSTMRPETTAMLSSDVGYIYIDSDRDLNFLKNSLVNYLPTIFNGSHATIYELPYLQPPTKSTVGYITPLVYDNKTIIPYIITASLNCSYQTIYSDDVYPYSTIFSPSDIPENKPISYEWHEGCFSHNAKIISATPLLVKAEITKQPKHSDVLVNLIPSVNVEVYRYLLITWRSEDDTLLIYPHGSKSGYFYSSLGRSSEWETTLLDLKSFYDVVKKTNLAFKNENITRLIFRTFGNTTYSIASIRFLENTFLSDRSNILNWVNRGGKLIIFGLDNLGFAFNSLGLQVNGKSEADRVSVGNKIHLLKAKVKLENITTRDKAVSTIGNYSLKEMETSGFAFQKKIGRGDLIYIYINPLVTLFEYQKSTPLKLGELTSITKEVLYQCNISLPEESKVFARFPLEKRWIGRYEVYGDGGFVVKGNITVHSRISGSCFLQHPLTAYTVLIDSIHVQKILENVTIDKINVIGDADLEICSNECSAPKQTLSVPSYRMLQFSNCTLRIKPSKGSILEIQMEKSHFVSRGEIMAKLDSALFLIRDPLIDVNGYINFTKVSLPFTREVWTENAKLIGNITFHVDYSDGNYFFCDELKGAYVIEAPSRYPKIEDNIPWKDILTSPFHILTLSCSVLILLFKTRETSNGFHKV